jgi:hypothetical protein
MRLQTVIDSVAHFFAGFEVGDVFAGEFYGFAGFGVTAGAGGAVVEGEAAEPADFYSFTGGQALGHVLEHEFDGKLYVFGRELILAFRDAFYKFRFGHSSGSSRTVLTAFFY